MSFTTGATDTTANLFLWKSGAAGASYADDVELTATPVQTYDGGQVGFNTQDPYFQTSASPSSAYTIRSAIPEPDGCGPRSSGT